MESKEKFEIEKYNIFIYVHTLYYTHSLKKWKWKMAPEENHFPPQTGGVPLPQVFQGV